MDNRVVARIRLLTAQAEVDLEDARTASGTVPYGQGSSFTGLRAAKRQKAAQSLYDSWASVLRVAEQMDKGISIPGQRTGEDS